jgi:type I restriction enzyme R subunit
MTREHAERLRNVFEELFPEHVGLLQVIHHGMERVHDGPYGDGRISQFHQHITRHHYTGDQIRFLRAVQDVFLTKKRLVEADLYEAPLTSFGRNAVDRFFSPDEIREIVALAEQVAA